MIEWAVVVIALCQIAGVIIGLWQTWLVRRAGSGPAPLPDDVAEAMRAYRAYMENVQMAQREAMERERDA